VVWHHSLLLMNGFNKTEAAVFSYRLCFLRAFPFISLLNLTLYYIQRNERQGREKKIRMGLKLFCRHLDTTEYSLEMDVMKHSTVERRC